MCNIRRSCMFDFFPKWAGRGGSYRYGTFWSYGIHDKVMMSYVYLLEHEKALRTTDFKMRNLWNIPKNVTIFVDSSGYTLLNNGLRNIPNLQKYIDFIEKCDANNYAVLDLPISTDLSINERIRRQNQTLKNSCFLLENKVEGKNLFGVIFGWNAKSISLMTKHLLSIEKTENFDGFAIGSLIPFSKNYFTLCELIGSVRRLINNRPVHAFGIGHIEGMYLCAALGVNSVDSTRYMIAGEFREYLLPQTGKPVYIGKHYKRKRDYRKIRSLPCFCPICKTEKIESITSHGANAAALVALHNLCIQVAEERLIKDAIRENWFEKLLKERAYMYKKLKKVLPLLLKWKLYERDYNL